MKLKSKRGEPESALAGGPALSFDKDPTPEELEALRNAEMEKQKQKKRELEDADLEKMRQAKFKAG